MIVVVSGLPRSGTSMMMQMLGAGGLPLLVDDARSADDDNPRGYFEYEPVKRLERDASWLADADGKAVKVICPLLYHLPGNRHYKVIFMKRPMAEVLRSQRVMLMRRRTRGSSLDDAALGAVFEKQVERVERWLGTQEGMSVLSVGYADTVQRPREMAARVAAFVGQALAIDEMARVVDSSLHRQGG